LPAAESDQETVASHGHLVGAPTRCPWASARTCNRLCSGHTDHQRLPSQISTRYSTCRAQWVSFSQTHITSLLVFDVYDWFRFFSSLSFNRLIATLKPQSNGPSYSNTVIDTLAADGWTVTFGTARKGCGCGGLRPHPVPSTLYQM